MNVIRRTVKDGLQKTLLNRYRRAEELDLTRTRRTVTVLEFKGA